MNNYVIYHDTVIIAYTQNMDLAYKFYYQRRGMTQSQLRICQVPTLDIMKYSRVELFELVGIAIRSFEYNSLYGLYHQFVEMAYTIKGVTRLTSDASFNRVNCYIGKFLNYSNEYCEDIEILSALMEQKEIIRHLCILEGIWDGVI